VVLARHQKWAALPAEVPSGRIACPAGCVAFGWSARCKEISSLRRWLTQSSKFLAGVKFQRDHHQLHTSVTAVPPTPIDAWCSAASFFVASSGQPPPSARPCRSGAPTTGSKALFPNCPLLLVTTTADPARPSVVCPPPPSCLATTGRSRSSRPMATSSRLSTPSRRCGRAPRR